MTKLLEETIRRVRALPDGERDAAPNALSDYIAHAGSLQLTDEQAAEARPSLANENRRFLSLDEAREQTRRFGE